MFIFWQLLRRIVFISSGEGGGSLQLFSLEWETCVHMTTVILQTILITIPLKHCFLANHTFSKYSCSLKTQYHLPNIIVPKVEGHKVSLELRGYGISNISVIIMNLCTYKNLLNQQPVLQKANVKCCVMFLQITYGITLPSSFVTWFVYIMIVVL